MAWSYHTQQRQTLMDFLSAHPDSVFSMEQLRDVLVGVSKSALYRNVNQLVSDGNLRRLSVDGKRLYQYVESVSCLSHLHLQCSRCGAITHLDPDMSQKLVEAIQLKAHFGIDLTQTTLVGRCDSCR